MNYFITLHDLTNAIYKELSNGSKLINQKKLLDLYIGSDWKKYIGFCKMGYKKNLVIRNDKIEVYVICWNKNQKSGIHDHSKNGCLLKILKGSLIEKIYSNENCVLSLKKSNALETNDISYQEGSIELHNIINNNECTVTLHIYSPPNHPIKFYCEDKKN